MRQAFRGMLLLVLVATALFPLPPATQAVPLAGNLAQSASCGDPYTPISAVQGNGSSSLMVGSVVTVEGIVVGDFQGVTRLNGFFLQDPDGDANPLTSEGIFVYYPGGPDVVEGDRLRVTGTVAEYNGMTELRIITSQTLCDAGASIPQVSVDLPEATNGDLERYEGMLVRIPETLAVSENYYQGRYGQVLLSAGGRLYQPNNGNGQGDSVAENVRRLLVLDDGSALQNPNPIPYIGAHNTLRAGDTVAGLTGVLDQGQSSASVPAGEYRLQPTAPVAFVRANARVAVPESVGGNVRVASFNTLNYFTSLGSAAVCGPEQNQICRGASTQLEFDRQRVKLVAAIAALDADVVGLIEIENTSDNATADLVQGLNDLVGQGTYAYVTPPAPGDDTIRVALIYKPAVVTPVGPPRNFQTSTAGYSPLFDRPPLAQAFRLAANGEIFTVVVNHLKSRSSCPTASDDPDRDYGQGCWRAKRTAQATALLDLVTDLQSVDPDVLIVGDLNAYGEEDPIDILLAAGLRNAVASVPATSRYTYVFAGEAGYLDHALVTASLDGQRSGATVWHINADEPSVLDYNTEFKPQDLYTATPYRSSDHDPVIVGLNLQSQSLPPRVYLPLVVR